MLTISSLSRKLPQPTNNPSTRLKPKSLNKMRKNKPSILLNNQSQLDVFVSD